LLSCRVLLGADDPRDAHAPVRRWLGLEEPPGHIVSPEQLLFVLGERGRPGLVRIGASFRRFPYLERLEAGRAHASLLDQLLSSLHVDAAPDAARPARGETDLVITVVDALSVAVDPAEAERLIDCLGPGDARTSSLRLVKAHPELLPAVVMLFEPVAELFRGDEEMNVL